jgi:hypothetical protein
MADSAFLRCGLIFGAEALMFFFATLNIRACAKGKTAMTLGTDAGIAGFNFFLIGRIAEQGDAPSLLAYIAGAMVGSYIGMWFSQHWKGE